MSEVENVRSWGDRPTESDRFFELSREELQATYPDLMGKPHAYLAISGGGANGAFGAGLLNGWSAAGTRPEFAVVTGISTGALTAPFAFLGSDYDDELKTFYTTTTTKDIMDKRNLINSLTSDAAANTEPLQELLAEVIDQDLMEKIAAEHRRGRRLLVGTTDLDSSRPVHWSIGAIAASGRPGSLELIRKVLLASAALPGAFPPVLIEVEADGEIYDELHVDGGAATQVFLYPSGVDWREVLDRLEVPGAPQVYVIRNSKLATTYKPVKNKVIPISGRTISSLIRTQGIGDLYRIYLLTKRDGIGFNLAVIPDDFAAEKNEQFDPAYMTELFETGYEMAVDGYPWYEAPPEMEGVED